MKKFLILCAAIIALAACSKDKLEGTTWSGSDKAGEGEVATLTFAATTFNMTVTGYDEGVRFEGALSGDYTYESSEVTLIAKTVKLNGVAIDAGVPMTGKVNGKKLELTVLGDAYLFVKK